jgi:hypothetical protein
MLQNKLVEIIQGSRAVVFCDLLPITINENCRKSIDLFKKMSINYTDSLREEAKCTSSELQRFLFSSKVQSILTIRMSGLSLNLAASSSQVGASLLQCPHHGAKNLTKLTPELMPDSKLSPERLTTGVSVSSVFGFSVCCLSMEAALL